MLDNFRGGLGCEWRIPLWVNKNSWINQRGLCLCVYQVLMSITYPGQQPSSRWLTGRLLGSGKACRFREPWESAMVCCWDVRKTLTAGFDLSVVFLYFFFFFTKKKSGYKILWPVIPVGSFSNCILSVGREILTESVQLRSHFLFFLI